MRRRALISRGQRQFWLAHKVASRRPLMVSIARHQRLAQAFGLTGPTAEVPGRAIILRGPGFDQAQHTALPDQPVASMNQLLEGRDQHLLSANQQSELLGIQDQDHLPPIVEGIVSSALEHETPPVQHKDALQPAEINEPVEVKSQQEQESVDDRIQPGKSAKTKRPRARIEEQPAEARPGRASPPAPLARVTRREGEGKMALERPEVNAAKDQEVIEADDLFAPRDADRSPQAWIARLLGIENATPDDVASPSATTETGEGDRRLLSRGKQSESNQQAAGNVARDTLQTRPTSTPLSQRTRRFLQPLLGIDPASVPVHRDALAGRLTDVYWADAVTLGDDVEVAAGQPDDTPETLGLLAHEFTHVARQREPHFIPPIIRSVGVPLATSSQASQVDEEVLALQVEGQVKRMAQDQVDQMAPLSTESAGEAIGLPTSSVPVFRSARDPWGGLPPPWEPLPDWLVASPEMAGSSTHAPDIPFQPSHATHEAGGTESRVSEEHRGGDRAGSLPGYTGVQRAGRERSSDAEEGQVTTSAQLPVAEGAKTPEPDLDALARQVYSILKRRLGVESRRES